MFDRRRLESQEGDPGVSVAAAIEFLRGELETARDAGADHRVQFGVESVEVTLTVVASRGGEANAGVRWWVVEAGGSGKFSRDVTQTLVLTLRPQEVAVDGTVKDLRVNAEDGTAFPDLPPVQG